MRSIVQPAGRPEVDAVYGIPPTVAIEQRLSRGGRKSTVGTLTEVHHFLRLAFVKLGTQYCPDCEVRIVPQSPEAILARVMRDQQVLNLRCDGLDATRLIADLRDIAFSLGSACASGSGRPSHVLRAIGLSEREARSSIRLGFGRYTGKEELVSACRRIDQAARAQQDVAA